MFNVEKMFNEITKPKAKSYFIPGTYEVELIETKFNQNYEGTYVLVGIALVLKSTNPEVPEGSTREYILKLTGKPQAADAKAFASQVLGKKFEETTLEDCFLLNEPRKDGEKYNVEATSIKLKSGADFVKCIWTRKK